MMLIFLSLSFSLSHPNYLSQMKEANAIVATARKFFCGRLKSDVDAVSPKSEKWSELIFLTESQPCQARPMLNEHVFHVSKI